MDTKRKYYNPDVVAAIDAAGGCSPAAKAIGVGYQTVYEWYIGERRVPPKRCPALAKLGGVPLDRIRPDMAEAWQAVREAA